MPINKEKFDQAKIDRLKHFLTSNAEKGHEKDYEIFVDTLKVVPRTNDPEEFESYEEFVNDDTERVRILIYNSPHSPRNDQYVFEMKEKRDESLHGFDLDNKINQRIENERKKWEGEQMRLENERLKAKVKEAEQYIEELEEAVEKEKAKKFRLGDIHVGEFASVMMEGMIRRNPQVLAKLPGGEALAGIIEQDNQEQQKLQPQPQPEESASYSKADDEETEESDQQYVEFIRELEERFTDEELQKVMLILQRLSEEKESIQEVYELIVESKTGEENHEEV